MNGCIGRGVVALGLMLASTMGCASTDPSHADDDASSGTTADEDEGTTFTAAEDTTTTTNASASSASPETGDGSTTAAWTSMTGQTSAETSADESFPCNDTDAEAPQCEPTELPCAHAPGFVVTEDDGLYGCEWLRRGPGDTPICIASNSRNVSGMRITQLTATGDVTWSSTHEFFGPEGIATSADGRVFVVGYAAAGRTIIGIDATGELAWRFDQTQAPELAVEWCSSAVHETESWLTVCGDQVDSAPDGVPELLRYDAAGTLVSSVELVGLADAGIEALAQIDGDIVTAGRFGLELDLLVHRANATTGEQVWSTLLDRSIVDYTHHPPQIAIGPSGSVAVLWGSNLIHVDDLGGVDSVEHIGTTDGCTQCSGIAALAATPAGFLVGASLPGVDGLFERRYLEDGSTSCLEVSPEYPADVGVLAIGGDEYGWIGLTRNAPTGFELWMMRAAP